MCSAISSFSHGLFAAALIGSLPCAGAFGQLFTWTNGAGGDWNTNTNWNPIGVPDGAGKSALINLAGTFTINLTGGPAPDSVQLLSTGGTIAVSNSAAFGIGGAAGLVNNGTVTINPTSGPNFTILRFSASAPLSGTGVVRLNAPANTLNSAYIETSGAGEVLHQSPHKIAGVGRVIAKVTNASTIVADVAGAVLEINGPIAQTGAGQLRADPGILGLGNGAAILGGALNIVNPGSWQVVSNPSMSGVTISGGTGEIVNSALLRILSGGLTNNGQLNVNNGIGPNFTILRIEEACTIGGTGIIMLRASGNLDTAYIDSPNVGAVLTQGPAHHIRGAGRIYATVVNQGEISATTPGQLLEVRGKVTQTGGGTISGVNADAGLGNGAIVTGGNFFTSGTGRVRITGDAQAGSFGLVGAMSVDNSALLRFLAGNIANNAGTITVNTTAGPNFTRIRIDEACSINGTGSILLNAGGNLDTAYIESLAGAALTNGTAHVIRGTGRVYAVVANNGTIRADQPDLILEIRSAINQGATGKIEGNQGILGLGNGAVITGGTLTSVGAGYVRSTGAAKIDGATNTGSLVVGNATTLALLSGGLINNSNVRINDGVGPNFTVLVAEQASTIGGSGTLTLRSSGNPDTAYIDGQAVGLTNGAGHTITGDGRIYGTVTNLGTFRGSSTSATSIVRIRGAVTQQGAGTIIGDVGSVGLESGSVTGGTFQSLAGPVRVLGGNSTVTNVENKGQLQIDNSGRLNAVNLINNGTITINNSIGPNFTSLGFTGVQTLGGLGTILFKANGNLDTAFLEVTGVGSKLTLGSGQTIRGSGRMYGEYESKATLSPGAALGALGRIEPRGGLLTLAPESRIDIDIVGGNPGEYDTIASSAAVALGGSLALAITGWNPNDPCISIDVVSGTAITGEFDSVTIDSPEPPAGRVWRLDYEPNKVSLHLTCAADLNGDCIVDDRDFTKFVFAYNLLDCADPAMPQDCPSDINHDGVVDDADFVIWIVAYNELICG